MQNLPSVLIVEDQKLVRLGLRLLFEERKCCHVVGEAEDGRSAVVEAHKLRPDIVFMDVNLPDKSGIEVSREIKSLLPGTKILISTSHQEVGLIAAAFEAGVDGYCLKDASVEHIDKGLAAVMQGMPWVAPPVADILVRLSDRIGKGRVKLSNTETKILGLMRQSFTNQEIAEELETDSDVIVRIVRSLISRLASNSEAN